MNDWFEAEKYVERANELYESGRLEDALLAYHEAIKVNPYQPEWHFSMGLTLETMGRFEEAHQSYSKAVEIGGDHVEMLNALGAICLRLNQPNEAIAAFEQVEQMNAADEMCYCGRIKAYSLLGDAEMADAMFYMVLEMNEESASAWFNIADSLVDREEFDRAIFCYRKALRFDPRDEQVFAKLAQVFWIKGDLEQSYRHFLEQIRRMPGDVETLLDMGNLLIEMKRPIEAAEKFRRVAELEPSNAEAHFYLGKLTMEASHLDAAQIAFERTLALNPKRTQTHMKLAGIALRRGQKRDAQDHIRQELELGALFDGLIDLRELGRLAIDAEDPDSAIRIYRRLAHQKNRHAGIRHELGVACLMAGFTHEGMQHCRQALMLDKKLPLAYHNLIVANQFLGNYRRALYWANKAVKYHPNHQRLNSLRSKARLLYYRALVKRRLRWLLP